MTYGGALDLRMTGEIGPSGAHPRTAASPRRKANSRERQVRTWTRRWRGESAANSSLKRPKFPA